MCSGWTKRSLDELAVYHNGRAFKPSEWTESGLPIVRIAQITNPNAEPHHYDGDDVDARHVIDNGDLLFSWSATLAVLEWKNGPAILNQHIFKVVENQGVCREFLRHLLQHSLPALADRSHGSTMKHIRKGVLKEHLVSVPTLRKQRKIAAILSSVDDAIDKTQAVIDQVQVVKRGLMQELLTRGLPGRHTQFKQTEIGEIPEEWEMETLDTLVQDGTSVTYGIVQAGPHVEHGVPYIKTGDMTADGIRLDGLARTAPSIASNYRRSEVRSGDLVFAIRASVGMVAEVPPQLDGANLTQGTARISPSVRVSGRYLLWALRGTAIQKWVARRTKGTTYREITLRTLRDVPVPVPTLDEQQALARVIDSLTSREASEKRRYRQLFQLKSALMSVLLNGEVRVNTDTEAA